MLSIWTMRGGWAHNPFIVFPDQDGFLMNRLSFLKLGLCALALGGVQGCALAVAGGVAGGVAAAQEGGLSRAVSDAKIQTQINHLWFQYNVDVFSKLDLTINQGRVLITGIVQDPEHRVEAVRLAWQPNGVKQVINEINVADAQGLGGYARDAWITGQLRTGMTFDKHVQSINYTIDTVQGTVYLMGIAQSQDELNRVIARARTISDVKQVVSYVKFAGVESGLNDGGAYEPRPVPVDNAYDNPADEIDWGEGDDQYLPQNTTPTPLTRPAPLQVREAPPSGGVQTIESETLLWGDNG